MIESSTTMSRKVQSTGNLQALENNGVRQDNIERHQAEIEKSMNEGGNKT